MNFILCFLWAFTFEWKCLIIARNSFESKLFGLNHNKNKKPRKWKQLSVKRLYFFKANLFRYYKLHLLSLTTYWYTLVTLVEKIVWEAQINYYRVPSQKLDHYKDPRHLILQQHWNVIHVEICRLNCLISLTPVPDLILRCKAALQLNRY